MLIKIHMEVISCFEGLFWYEFSRKKEENIFSILISALIFYEIEFTEITTGIFYYILAIAYETAFF